MHYLLDFAYECVRKDNQTEIFRCYVADALKAICKNTSNLCGGEVIQRRYSEITAPKEPVRSEKEIIADMKKKLSEMGDSEDGQFA